MSKNTAFTVARGSMINKESEMPGRQGKKYIPDSANQLRHTDEVTPQRSTTSAKTALSNQSPGVSRVLSVDADESLIDESTNSRGTGKSRHSSPAREVHLNQSLGVTYGDDLEQKRKGVARPPVPGPTKREEDCERIPEEFERNLRRPPSATMTPLNASRVSNSSKQR